MTIGPMVGFACNWDRRPEGTWSGTPWNLRAALRERVDLADLDVGPPVAARALLKVAGLRRAHGQWKSLWRHGALNKAWVERTLSRLAAQSRADVVVEVQDLGRVPQPYLLVQDLSYGLLLRHFGADGVPHFRTLGERRIRRLHERQVTIYEHASMILPMSRWLAEDLVASGVPAERVRVVNPGINVTVAPNAPVPERRRGQTRRLLFIGRDFDTKGGGQVVDAFRLLRAELGPAIELTVMGPPHWPLPGPVPAGVDFRGPQTYPEVAKALDAHDLFVMPSRFEGFGMAFAEALVRGLPCIGRDACAMPEIIDLRGGGRLVTSEDPGDLADVITEALGDDGLYAACAAAARRRRLHFTWERAADEVAEAISGIG